MPSSCPSSLRLSVDPAVNGAPIRPGKTKLFLLGGFELQAGKQSVLLPLRVQRLAVFLALANRRLHRAYVSGRLWLDATQEQAYGSLRAALWETRLVACPLVEASATHVALSPSVRVDTHELSVCADRLLNDGAIRWNDVDQLAQAGELLPDWYEDWVVEERQRLHEHQVLALEAAAAALIRERRYSHASFAALAAVNADPLRESAYDVLIRSYLASGNVAGALQQFAALDDRLRGVGLQPTLRIQALMRGIA